MKRAISALALMLLYVVVALAPLSFIFFGQQPHNRPFLVELSVALGFVGLSMMGLQFALVARFKPLTNPFGIDVVHRFHKEVSFVALIFILAHPILLLVQNAARYLPLFEVETAPWRARFAIASVALLLLLIALSVWRQRLRIPYELWQITHSLLAIVVVVLAVAHANGVGYYTAGPVRRTLFDVTAVALVGVQVWARLVTPLRNTAKPWRVVSVEPERARSTTLVIEPVGHDGFDFKPGQFAWLSRWPLAFAQHPFSISSPGDVEPRGQVTVTIKALGDWSRQVRQLKPGRHVYIDGPHGEFSMDLYQAPGYVFIAAGVGITPLFSMVGTMCLRGDVRPAILFYANHDWDGILFREQLEELAERMPSLEVVHVLQRVPAFWRGETGRITADVLRRHLPARQYRRFEYFICGSESMMDAVEQELASLGVAEDRVHTERFTMV
jgi:predicted ferric reductase